MGRESVAVPREVLLKEMAEADALWTVLADSIDREVLVAGTKLKVVAIWQLVIIILTWKLRRNRALS